MQHNALCLIPPTKGYTDEDEEKSISLKKIKLSKCWLKANPFFTSLVTNPSSSGTELLNKAWVLFLN